MKRLICLLLLSLSVLVSCGSDNSVRSRCDVCELDSQCKSGMVCCPLNRPGEVGGVCISSNDCSSGKNVCP